MHLVKERAHEFGVRGLDPSALSLDLSAVVSRKNKIVQGIIDDIYEWVEPNPNVTFIRGRAEFNSPVNIQIDGKVITAQKSIIATGSRTADINVQGLDDVGFLTSSEALDLQTIPSSLIIIGAGYVGVEFAQMYGRYGTSVTLLSRSERIMKRQEPELSKRLTDILNDEGIDVRLGATAVRAEMKNREKVIVAEINGDAHHFRAEEILFAGGRVPRVDGFGLAEAGVQFSGEGIQVNEMLRTTAENIWSLGDVNGGAMFTHRATYDGPIAALNAIKDAGRSVDYRVIPRAIFTEPALASVGLTEQEALDAGYNLNIGEASFKNSGRAQVIGQTEGKIKLIADSHSNELLGGHFLGAHADILIHQVVTAMYHNSTAESLYNSMHIHPTLSEKVKDAAKELR